MFKEKQKQIDIAKVNKELEKLFNDPQKEPDRESQNEKYQKLFDMYNTKGLVNVKNLVLKNPEQRSVKEVEFLILYLKFKFPVFFEIDRRTLEYFVKRLSFALYKPGELLAIKGEVCKSMVMIIDGEVDAME